MLVQKAEIVREYYLGAVKTLFKTSSLYNNISTHFFSFKNDHCFKHTDVELVEAMKWFEMVQKT